MLEYSLKKLSDLLTAEIISGELLSKQHILSKTGFEVTTTEVKDKVLQLGLNLSDKVTLGLHPRW